jgi:hypothetical protein
MNHSSLATGVLHRRRPILFVSVFVFTALAWAADGDAMPEALRPWASDQYSVRYFLRVEPSPAAGSTEILPEAEIASLYLPLARFTENDGKTPRLEQVLLLDESGQVQPVFMRPVSGGNEIEIAFPTKLARRCYSLYAGAKDGRAEQTSPQAYEPSALTVRIRGYSTPAIWSRDAVGLTAEKLDQAIRRGLPIGDVSRRQLLDGDPPFEENPRRDRGSDHGAVPTNDRNYAAVCEGYLRVPVSGTYGFSVNTFGLVDLQVDGASLLTAGTPDEERPPFRLTGQTELRAGIHRVSIRHAQAGGKAGLHLLWKTPGRQDFIAVPAQAFPRALPAVVLAREENHVATPFIGVELAGFYRTGVQQGLQQAREWVDVLAYGSGSAEGVLVFRSSDTEPVEGPASGARAWLPAGQLIDIEWRRNGRALTRRAVLFPTGEQGGRDRTELTGELTIKEAARFIYPDETGQFHFETQLSPIIPIINKQRHTRGPELPHPLPVGSFRLTWRLTGVSSSGTAMDFKSGELDATPDLTGRRKIRLPLEMGALEVALRERSALFEVILQVGGIPVGRRAFRLLHSRADWDGRLEAQLDRLVYVTGKEASNVEETVFLLPREDDSAYRRFNLPLLDGKDAVKEALFLGDPWVEPTEASAPGAAAGLSARLAAQFPDGRWSHLCVPGPHRGYYIFRLLAAADRLIRSTPNGKLPPLAVLSLGSGDMIRQTPGYDFERGLDLLVDRLRQAGTKRIFVVGVLPIPEQEKASLLYQTRAGDAIRHHHLEGLDLVAAWLKTSDWTKRFLIPFDENAAPAYAPVPNAETIEKTARQVADRIR